MTLTRDLFYLIFLLGLVACEDQADPAQDKTLDKIITKTVEAHELSWDAAVGLMKHNDLVFSGRAVIYNSKESKSIIASTEYLQGRKNGFDRKWFNNEELSYECQFRNGQKEGYSKSWWNTGQLRSKSNFLDGKGHGVQEQWYRNGALFKKRNLSHGKEEGMQQSWRENGKIYNNYEAKNGRIFGLKRASLCFKLEDEVVQYED